MTPKDKAKELIVKYQHLNGMNNYDHILSVDKAKQCALISVNEILKDQGNINVVIGGRTIGKTEKSKKWLFWQQVKQEIEKL